MVMRLWLMGVVGGFCGLGLLLTGSNPLWGVQDKGGDSVAPAGVEQITEGRVTATISFLASDELAGRATGSAEFNIAASYVASRFRGAGLVGGAADGGFYHETMVKMVRTPSEISLTDADDRPIVHYGLLSAGPTALEHSGPVHRMDLSKELPGSGLQGVVGGSFASDAKGPRLVSQVMRIANTLKAAGASGLLLGVPADSELLSMAKELREKPQTESPRSRFALPVLLVPEKSLEQTSIRWSAPATIVTEFPMRNVIGKLEGSDPALKSQAILFTAHLDHLGTKAGEGDRIYNGADDDATGCTAVVTLADAFGAGAKPKRTLLFMTFWGEESGLLGSKQFVANPSWPLDQIVANVNIEMIGRPEAGARSKIWMTGWNESDLGVLMQKGAAPFGVEVFEHPRFSAMLYRASDNWSFVEKGVVAHSFSAGSLHPDYHQPDDEWDRLDLAHMTKVIQGLYVGAIPLANSELKPTKGKPAVR